ncbi:MAG: S8 family peptidase [Flavobacteriales bacterium]|nr:S8 family peptidase [Flavobacteriales bacterium]
MGIKLLLRIMWTVGLVWCLLWHAQGQEPIKGNLWLTASKTKDLTETWNIYVKGNDREIESFLNQNNLVSSHSIQGFKAITLSKKLALELAQKSWVDQLRIEYGKGEPLLNESRIHTNSDAVHAGHASLPSAYTGKGVLIGFLDTGIDFDHPDFKFKNGKTRVLHIWDQTRNQDSTLRPTGYSYGEAYDSSRINAGTCPHVDPNNYHGHGTMVAGVGASNGNSVPDSIADYRGHAPEAGILYVATNFNSNTWTQTVAEGVAWMFEKADALQMPCVVNISAGSYLGSHDGLDLPALFIDSLLAAKSGRSVVCAAGNAGAVAPFHFKGQIVKDTLFTWFKPNMNSGLGYPAVFFEVWADTARFHNLEFGMGFTDTTLWADTLVWRDSIQFRLDTLKTMAYKGSTYLTWAERQGSRYLLQALVTNPNPKYHYAFQTTGTGGYDIWSGAWLGHSDMVYQSLPTASQYPNIRHLGLPDTLQSMVSSFTCSPNVITVGNYNNRGEYENVDGTMRQFAGIVTGALGETSSSGPTRLGYLKPDVAAPGNVSVTTGRIVDVNYLSATPSQRYKLAKGGFHFSNGGTSMAAPVVSGIVAMMLEKCPNLTQHEIILMIQQSAYKDVFTGPANNYNFGNGKVNALSALQFSNINEKLITPSKGTVFCQGDSIEIRVSANYQRVLWNNGDSSNNVFASSTDTIFAYVTNLRGCKEYSDTVYTTVNPLPSGRLNLISKKSAFCPGDSAVVEVSPHIDSLLWKGSIAGDNYTAYRSDTLWAMIIDSNGCRNQTDTILVTSFEKPNIKIAGDSILCREIGLSKLYAFGAQFYTWSNGVKKDTVSVRHGGSYMVEAIDSNNCKGINSVLVVEKDCFAGVSENGFTDILLYPNPVNNELTIHFSGLAVYPFEVRVVTLQGVEVWSQVIYSEGDIKWNANVPSGLYFVQVVGDQYASLQKVVIQH